MSTSQFTPFETLELIHKWLYGLREAALHEGITQPDFRTQPDVPPPLTSTSEATLVQQQQQHLSWRYQYSTDHLQSPGTATINGKLLEQAFDVHILSYATQRHHKDDGRMHKRKTEEGEETRKRRRERSDHFLPTPEDVDLFRAQAAAHHPNPDIARPIDKYTRRKRHKTRDDSYEARHDLTKPKSKSKRKPRYIKYRKSGQILNEEFDAPNVRSNRLSLSSGRGPSIFDHLKISAPRQKQDLPDLSFSEMKYLKSRPFEQTPDRGQTTPISSSFFMEKGPSRSRKVTRAWTTEPELPVSKRPKPKPSRNEQTLASDVSWSTSPYHRGTIPWVRPITRPSSPLFWSGSPQSSVTGYFLQNWATDALLQGVDSLSHGNKQCYSLDDLKALAQDRTLFSASADSREEQPCRAWPSRWRFDSIDHDTEPQGQGKVPKQHHIQPARYTIMYDGNPELNTQNLAPDDFQVPQTEPQTHSVQPKADATCEVSPPTASHIRTGPQYSSYWPSLQPNETVRVSMDTEQGWHRRYQDLGRNEVAWTPIEDPFRQTSVDTYNSQAYVDFVDPDKVTPPSDVVDRYSQALSDGLDEFDLELMQTDPVNFPPSERTGVMYSQHRGGWQREEEDNRQVTPFAMTTTLMTEPTVMGVDGDEGDHTKPRWLWDHSSTKIHQSSARYSSWATQSGHYASSGTIQVPYLPQKGSPFKAFSRPHHPF